MTKQEQFEADYLAAFPETCQYGRLDGGMGPLFILTKKVWLQQAKRHEAEIAELVAALKRARAYIIDDHGAGNVLDVAIAKYEVKK